MPITNTQQGTDYAQDMQERYPEHEIAFDGFGGTASSMETLVFSVDGYEVRIPTHPQHFSPEDVSNEYHCISAHSLDEAIEDIAGMGK